jgi:hypothetical protein
MRVFCCRVGGSTAAILRKKRPTQRGGSVLSAVVSGSCGRPGAAGHRRGTPSGWRWAVRDGLRIRLQGTASGGQWSVEFTDHHNGRPCLLRRHHPFPPAGPGSGLPRRTTRPACPTSHHRRDRRHPLPAFWPWPPARSWPRRSPRPRPRPQGGPPTPLTAVALPRGRTRVIRCRPPAPDGRSRRKRMAALFPARRSCAGACGWTLPGRRRRRGLRGLLPTA